MNPLSIFLENLVGANRQANVIPSGFRPSGVANQKSISQSLCDCNCECDCHSTDCVCDCDCDCACDCDNCQ